MPHSSSTGGDVTARGEPWFAFVRAFLVTFVAILAGLLLWIGLIDPYDSGRTPLSLPHGTTDKDSRFVNASYVRNPRFNAAIIGNSHGQALHPDRLTELTGLNFVQMTIAGTTPREQILLMKRFSDVRPGDAYKAIVLVVDDWWCTHDRALPLRYDFPFWLYGDDTSAYLKKLLSTQSFDRALRRSAYLAGFAQIRNPTGFDDYEIAAPASFQPPNHDPAAAPAPFDPTILPKSFPAIEKLKDVLDNDLRGRAVVAVMPYVHRAALPLKGSKEDADLANCKMHFAEVIGNRPNSRFIDLRVDDPLARDAANFIDLSHYRKNVAMVIESRIAAALAAAK